MKLRKTLAGLALMASLALNGCSLTSSNYSQKVKTPNEFVKYFPVRIPSVGKTMTYNVMGSKHVLVHIRQIHNCKNISKEDLETVGECQKDIYDIVRYLKISTGLREVYDEGLIDDRTERVKKYYAKVLTSDFDNFTSGAATVLYAEKAIELKPAEKKKARETSDSLDKMLEDYKKKGWEDVVKNITPSADYARYSLREDTLLELIDENKDSIAYTIYGAGHKWMDNIERWNTANPTNRFSLIEITPESIEDR